jgi:thiamine biosynthesis lipoprotein
MLHTDAFRAMDTDIDIEIAAPARPHAAFVSMRLLFEEQEQSFSRFRDSSLLSRLNRGETVTSRSFAASCRMAIEAFEFTSGLFNPMVLPALRDAGYDRTFREITVGSPRAQPIPDAREAIVIDENRVTLARGQLDLGGIVKGWTADLAVEAVAAEYEGVLVNAGGDVRATGTDTEKQGWQLAIERPGGGRPLWTGTLTRGCATSTTLRRQWKTPAGGSAHHLIDPRTGLPSSSPFVQATVWAPETWRAEVWAKGVLIGGEDAIAAALSAGLTVLTFDVRSEVRTWGPAVS